MTSAQAGAKKRLGQYFTHERLSRLLAALARAEGADAVIDPMVGTGNMLRGALAVGARPRVLAGVDIDPGCLRTARERLAGESRAGRVHLDEGDAFVASTLAGLPAGAWDLVITNPPYVRYQSAANGLGDGLPSARAIRRSLIDSLDALEHLSAADRTLFALLAASYSGLADLAVPAWLLCAALLRTGGTLAMVVPDTWMSRDYARPIQYLLARCFDLEFVVRDTDATWFEDALVRTTLVVARRIDTRASAFEADSDAGHLEIALGEGASDSRSMVGALHRSAHDPDHDFACLARRWLGERKTARLGASTATWVPRSSAAAALRRALGDEKWLARAEPRHMATPMPTGGPLPPLRLAGALELQRSGFVALDDLGWRVGQGLRTGANVFFYGERCGEDADDDRVLTSRRMGRRLVSVPADAMLPVVRGQADLPESLVLDVQAVRGRVLILTRYALPEHAGTDGAYRAMDEQLAALVREAAKTNVGTSDDPRLIPQLSAVRTNVRNAAAGGGGLTRSWYHLPSLTPRHRPDLLLARVNHAHPRALLNPNRGVVIDANFSSMWREREDGIEPLAMLAFMNSAWTRCVLELIATAMGGGALKVEATHLRRMPIPALGDEAWRGLACMGGELARGEARRDGRLVDAIDRVLLNGLSSQDGREPLDVVREIAVRAQAERRR
jgi:hypothetical protein